MIIVVLLYVGAVLFCNGIWLLGKIEDGEIAAVNIFAGSVGFVAGMTAMILGAIREDTGSQVFGAQVLLFAFTYFWVAYNRYSKADGRGLGWYSLFVAATAVPAAFITLGVADSPWLYWLGFSWIAWAVLWFLYWVLLALQRPIARLAGWVTLLEGIFTGWLPACLFMAGSFQLA